MSIIADTDFIGKYQIALTTFNAANVQLYIDRYEPMLMRELLGVELFDLYEAGITGIDPIYEKLRDAFIEQLDNGKILESKGVVDMLTGFIYFYFSRDQYTQQTSAGAVKNKGENSTNASFAMSMLNSRWNEALDTYQAIQDYIRENIDVYPTFKGVQKYTVLSL